jgi:hypothetical protein
MSAQLRSGGGGGMQTVGYEAAHPRPVAVVAVVEGVVQCFP